MPRPWRRVVNVCRRSWKCKSWIFVSSQIRAQYFLKARTSSQRRNTRPSAIEGRGSRRAQRADRFRGRRAGVPFKREWLGGRTSHQPSASSRIHERWIARSLTSLNPVLSSATTHARVPAELQALCGRAGDGWRPVRQVWRPDSEDQRQAVPRPSVDSCRASHTAHQD